MDGYMRNYYLQILLQTTKIIKAVILILIGVFLVLFTTACKNDRNREELTLPRLEDVSEVRIKREDKTTITNDEVDIKAIYSMLSNINNKIGENYNDTPMCDDYIIIEFADSSGTIITRIFANRYEDTFCIEQSYNGIFSIDDEDYYYIIDLGH